MRAFATLVAFLALSGTAQASVLGADGRPLPRDWAQSIAVAERVMPAAGHHCPTVTIGFSAPIVFPTAGMEADPRTCTVTARPELREAEFRADTLCPRVVHEWGHLAWLGHSGDPANVMHATAPWIPACGRTDAQVDRLVDRFLALIQLRRATRSDRRRTRLIRRIKALRTVLAREHAVY